MHVSMCDSQVGRRCERTMDVFVVRVQRILGGWRFRPCDGDSNVAVPFCSRASVLSELQRGVTATPAGKQASRPRFSQMVPCWRLIVLYQAMNESCKREC